MREKHDVLADPLPPHLRRKLEIAAKRFPLPPTAPPAGTLPVRYADRGQRFDRSLDDLVVQMLLAGVPYRAIGGITGATTASGVANRVRYLRKIGLYRGRRGMGWKPPPDWKRRLDDILKKAEK